MTARCMGPRIGIAKYDAILKSLPTFRGAWPHLCTGAQNWHPFWSMKDAECYEP